ncbi:1-(5-phosphoribosyl)-5-[(5-phosphoribosylamino)methylideneamino]imidazole-4-carboxamide isomerase [Wenzhouxiangella sp. XN24]|uniref:1-(5-phosphoribosyl)-5-[(5- phosphoribosylamino)methylideneamino]imidazole-4- carboxamide isomerase n=1 Tax=Wenzhouxiangella sp. XN24 TaxID=2713569 RepID=UPI0013EAB94E|nr:1-(5-phosphoribosyl)-5-[(5-phosphoribosylamino)methylideneamino]imidazole-4-carboxamide isomerase [Wenzhouxiangella sp. XN24]NGX15654.1 1-(5-phosphoribosyl)-5-[(5-phosphoribosylamino)methylideneamino]imidazole-4-carboxamide isomerase [Wenzhouxiangella sp. XN24]
MSLKPIPAIDLKDGRCVRLYQGRFDQVSEYEACPEDLAGRYLSLGVDWVHVVDLDGARDGAGGNREVIGRMAGLARGRIQVGGGIRTAGDVEAMLAAGVGRVVIGSAAAERPDEVAGWFPRFGAARLVLAFDVQIDDDGVPWCRTRGWTEDAGLSLWDAIEAYQEAGLQHLLCTDVARDGAMTGPNIALYTECTKRYPEIRLQASGGVRDLADVEALRATGASGAIIGKALLDGRITDEEIRSFLQNA